MAFANASLCVPKLWLNVLLRRFSYCNPKDDPCPPALTGLVLGVYTDFDQVTHLGKLTPTADRYDQVVDCRMNNLMQKYAKPAPDLGEVKIFYNLERQFAAVALVGLGKECQGYDIFEEIDEGKEAVRIAAAAGKNFCKAENQPYVSELLECSLDYFVRL